MVVQVLVTSTDLMPLSCVQTPTPHPNSYKMPRACASKPVRGPLDAHFRRVPRPAKRAHSLPTKLDSSARKRSRSESNPAARRQIAPGAGGKAQTPGFTSIDPRPLLGSVTASGPSSEDYQVLNGAAKEPSSTGNDTAGEPTSAAQSLTPRLDNLAVTAAATCAGQICMHMDTVAALHSAVQSTLAGANHGRDTVMADVEEGLAHMQAGQQQSQQWASIVPQASSVGQLACTTAGNAGHLGKSNAGSGNLACRQTRSRTAAAHQKQSTSTPAHNAALHAGAFSFTSPPAAHNTLGSTCMHAPHKPHIQQAPPTPAFGVSVVGSAQQHAAAADNVHMADAQAGMPAQLASSQRRSNWAAQLQSAAAMPFTSTAGDAAQEADCIAKRLKRRGLSTRSVNARRDAPQMVRPLATGGIAHGASGSKPAVRSCGFGLRDTGALM